MRLTIDVSQESLEFVRRMFTQYYHEFYELYAPANLENREFGFSTFGGQGMLRHVSFKSENKLRTFMERAAPSNAYYSCAYYEQPDVAMDQKGWFGADLIFDIDADHIPTSCSKTHDEWTCDNCKFVGRGLIPEKCPVCKCQKFDVKTWSCDECLDSAKAETIKLLDILRHDFGFLEEDIHVFFSGHRGYHVHIENETIRMLDAVTRKEIVDFVLGSGLDTSFGERKHGKAHFPPTPRSDVFGYYGRLAKGMYDFVFNAKYEDYKNLGLRRNVVEALIQNRDVILRNWNSVGPFRAVKGVGVDSWKRIVKFCKESLSAKIDTVVTTDVHRLIRLANSLHGKTGLKKVEFPASGIDVFDPFKNALAFQKGTVTVFVSSVPEFRLNEETFGPYTNCKVEMPTAAAILLICKGKAEIVEQNV